MKMFATIEFGASLRSSNGGSDLKIRDLNLQHGKYPPMYSLANAFTSALKELERVSQLKATADAAEFLKQTL